LTLAVDGEANPTASHALGELQATPLNAVDMAPTGLGAVWIVQAVPFQPSASGIPEREPTAVQAVDDAHDTPASRLVVAPIGFGVDWTCQAVPFHPSASVVSVWVLPEAEPTAVHWLDETQATPERKSALVPAGAGTDWTDQLLPFHLSARGKTPPVEGP
jgi:hypothetical protein